ncbi:MAG: DNA-3-methyladenine glycosylase [Spirochaetota bacterium]
MRKNILPRNFYTRPTLEVAKSLLGKYLVRRLDQGEIAGKIVETEAYLGVHDGASHALGGKRTGRNRAVYMVGGHAYIYLIYGMYWLINISTENEGIPKCVLIRAIEPNNGNYKETNGPGKLCRWLKLDKSFYAEDLTCSNRLWIEDRHINIDTISLISRPRVGVDYAGEEWSQKPLRFYIKGNPAVSRP